jgi:hypothetical protein
MAERICRGLRPDSHRPQAMDFVHISSRRHHMSDAHAACGGVCGARCHGQPCPWAIFSQRSAIESATWLCLLGPAWRASQNRNHVCHLFWVAVAVRQGVVSHAPGGRPCVGPAPALGGLAADRRQHMAGHGAALLGEGCGESWCGEAIASLGELGSKVGSTCPNCNSPQYSYARPLFCLENRAV